MFYRIYSISAQLSEHKFFDPQAHVLFLHRNMQYNNIQFVTGVIKNTGGGGGGRIDPFFH